MSDHGDHHISGKIVLSLEHKTDRSHAHSYLKDNFDACDKHTASSNSIDANCDNNLFLDEQLPKNPVEDQSEILQPVPISHNADPTVATLIATLNRINYLILQQSKRMGALEQKQSSSPPQRH